MQDLRLPRKGPTAEAIVCLGDRVIGIPTAAEPRDLNSQISTLNSFFRALSGTAAPRRKLCGWAPCERAGLLAASY